MESREAQPRLPLMINGKPGDWRDYRRDVADFVPDPMMLRAADLFLMGREKGGLSACEDLGGAERVWHALDRNVPGILAFFDLLVTRERIPLIDYLQTFSDFHSSKRLDGRLVDVSVAPEDYHRVKSGALAKLKRCRMSRLSRKALEDVETELDAFGWEWHPTLDGIVLPETRRSAAQFMLGGLIFGAYAQASGTEHLLQSKRSGLWVALSLPDSSPEDWAWETEEKLFETLRQTCQSEEHVRYEDRPSAPPVVPYLLSAKTPPETPAELLESVLEFRDSAEGRAYRQRWLELRGGLARGRIDPEAHRDIGKVAAELKKRFGRGLEPREVQVDFELTAESGGLAALAAGNVRAKVSADKVAVRLPRSEWLRRWVVETFIIRDRYSRVLMRLSTANREYQNVTLALRNLWNAA